MLPTFDYPYNSIHFDKDDFDSKLRWSFIDLSPRNPISLNKTTEPLEKKICWKNLPDVFPEYNSFLTKVNS